jgi:hypothetical protein
MGSEHEKRNKPTQKEPSMNKAFNEGPLAALRPVELRLNRLVVKIINAFRRLAKPDRRRVMRLFDEFTVGKTSTASDRYPWSIADIERCCLQLQPFSQKMANDFRRWASEYRETEHQFRLAFRAHIAEVKEAHLVKLATAGSRARVPGHAGRVPKKNELSHP